jgi:predicted nuclease of predicted toxin-antitoxin system
MNFLADQDVYANTVNFLKGLGHTVATAAQLGLGQAEDSAILRTANQHGQIFVTRDRDFGGLVFVGHAGKGVLYLRILPSNQEAVHEELKRVLGLYSAETLLNAFLVVEPGRHRLRKVPQQ